MKNICKTVLSAVLVCLVAPAFAVTLNPSGVVLTTGVTIGVTPSDPVPRPELGGVVISDDTINFSHDPTPATPLMNIGGAVQNHVIRNGDGNLIFGPRIHETFNIDGGTFAILGFSLDGYAGYSVNVDFRTDDLGDKGFTSVSRSNDGNLMTFRYDDPLFVDSIDPPGRQEESFFPAILTDAKAFTNTGTMTIFGEIVPLGADASSGSADNLFSFTVDGIAVPSAIPVPAAGILLLGGLGLLGGLARRTRRRS